MREVVFVALAGAFGALSRWSLSTVAARLLGTSFPFGTLVVNLLGCLLLGFIMHIALNTDIIPPSIRLAVSVGFLGALTTFSTFSYETIRLIQDGSWSLAVANIAFNLLLGLGAVLIGLALARLVLGGQS